MECIWSKWENGECSKTCGGGNRTNTRVKIVEEMHDGICEGDPTVIEECNMQECPGT